ncbi:hypothetical protein FOG51_02212 [Hanseniaspora uvarum]|jgi:protein phosphatase 1 regulatory subunit 11|uniref:Type 1 phosphatases regulator n=1 Tax=Hanseniaspora uvarum TaxID=29833 RepID=A0A1E5RCJ5_HANUV|nr:hypothetical protein FOG51_02212 [Hanseniaspora uvarum]KAF0275916.1 hypothetical protein FOG50_03290 [Hanseniaspora uvarum]KKA03265.1 Type 1 phosphatases regulator HuYPI1 [Hanseniaspora uvarum DSM 2768]OEJ84612.1 Type 1 phosphatases regulator YPI1 [Hanseniaspora uvarum]GMM41331.1 type 1 protein phosphatase-activating protein [Hanseniaspora uvarum]
MVETRSHTIHQEEQVSSSPNPIILNLTGQNHSDESGQHQVRFTEDTVDNEHMNKKKTKICCIYHPNEEEEASCTHTHGPKSKEDEIEDLSSEDEDEENLTYSERRAKRIERRKRELEHLEKSEYVPSNSYEIQPDYTNKQK